MMDPGFPADKYSIRTSREIAAEITKEFDSARMQRLIEELNNALDREEKGKHSARIGRSQAA